MCNENAKCCWEKLKKTQDNRKVLHVSGLEDSILLRYRFSPNWSTESKQFQSKFELYRRNQWADHILYRNV